MTLSLQILNQISEFKASEAKESPSESLKYFHLNKSSQCHLRALINSE